MIIFVNDVAVPAEPGDSILSALRHAGRDLQTICGGRGMCGTCRVAIDAEWFAALAEPAAQEARLLRVLKEAQPHHRLACQTELADRHDGLRFTLSPPPTRVLQKETTA